MTDALARLAHDCEVEHVRQHVDAMRADLAAGTVPVGMHRALFAHEVAARTNFAGIEDDVSREATILAGQLGMSRGRMIELIVAAVQQVATVASPVGPIQRIAQLIFDADGPEGLNVIPGASALLAEDEQWHRGRLTVGAATGFGTVLREAGAQSLPVPEGLQLKLDADAADHLDLAARRLAQAPQVDLVTALRERVYVEPRAFVAPHQFIDRLNAFARTLSPKPLAQYGSDAAAQAHGIGRLMAADQLPEAAATYASEILDRNTCGPCSMIDGHEYTSPDEGRADYPFGQYAGCEGGPRCRGTLVYVWSTEAEPTLQTPGA